MRSIQRRSKILSALILSSMVTFIPMSANGNNAFNGFYTGVGIGASTTTAKLNSQVSSFSNDIVAVFNSNAFSNASFSQQLKKESLLGAVYGGYGFTCAPYYLGGELFVKISNRTISVDNGAAFSNQFFGNDSTESASIVDSTKFTQRRVEFSLDARPGILLSACSLFYGRVGISFNRSSLNSTVTRSTVGVDEGIFISQTLVESGSKNLGLRLGLGIEQMFCNCVALRLDYIFTKYRKINLNSSVTSSLIATGSIRPATIINTFSDSRTIRPINQSVMLGLTYYW